MNPNNDINGIFIKPSQLIYSVVQETPSLQGARVSGIIFQYKSVWNPAKIIPGIVRAKV